MYEFVDAAVLRLTAQAFEPPRGWPDATADPVDLVGWLRTVHAVEPFAQAIEVASPVLADQIARTCQHPNPDRREVGRVVRATVKYLLRATTRATPFGLFAGVAPLRFGDTTDIRFGDRPRVLARVDGTWLAGVLDRLHHSRPLVRGLSVAVTDLAVIRDGRLVLPTRAALDAVGQHGPPSSTPSDAARGSAQDARRGATTSGPAAAGSVEEVSVRLTPAVAAVMELAREPVPFARLVTDLCSRFPATPAAMVESMLFELVDHQLLLTALYAPMTVTDPLSHLIRIATTAGSHYAGADSADAVAPLLAALREARGLLDTHDQAASTRQRRLLRLRAAERLRGVHPADRPVGVDLRVDVRAVLPVTVGAEVERAAAVMSRLAVTPGVDTPWGDYHRRFLDRYGPGALVPVSELLYGADGLGYPAGYRDSTLPRPASRQPVGGDQRGAALIELAQRAAWERRREVDLTGPALADLTATSSPDHTLGVVRPHVEIRAEVHAATRAGLDRGEFALAVLSVSRSAGTLTGRFLDLLDPLDQVRMRGVYSALPTLTAGALQAQLSCPPLVIGATTTTRTPTVLGHRIALGQPHSDAHAHGHPNPDGRRIELEDLAVSADNRGLYLVSLDHGRPVEPHLFGAIELLRVAHPTLRFLAEITAATAPILSPFAWGPAQRLPFLPRIRHGRTILTPAQWRLHPTDLNLSDGPQGDGGVQAWRQQWAVPDIVLLGDDDRRLRLDLTEPAHCDVLREHLHRSGHATILEAPAAEAFGWLDHRPHEVVLPVVATAPSPHPVRPRPTAALLQRREPVDVPGAGRWLSARLHGRPEHLARVLVQHLPGLLACLPPATAGADRPRWWFLRHDEPGPHLRLRIPLPAPDAFAEAVTAIGTWAAQLVKTGMLGGLEIDSYRVESGRFGHGVALDTAHAVFAADSAAALAQLQLAEQHRGIGPAGLAMTAASLLDLVTAFAPEPADGWRWLLDHGPRTADRTGALGRAAARRVRADTLALTGPDGTTGLQALPGGGAVIAAWQQRAGALAAYRDALHAQGVGDPTVVLPDLLHLHHARTVGLSLDSEHRCLHLARAGALSRLHRTPATT